MVSQRVSLFWCKYVLTGINSLRPGKKLSCLANRNEVRSRPLLSLRNCCLFLCLWYELWSDSVLTWREANTVWFHWEHVKSVWLQGSSPLTVLWLVRSSWSCGRIKGEHTGGVLGTMKKELEVLPKMNVAIICYGNLILQSGTNSCSPVGVILLFKGSAHASKSSCPCPEQTCPCRRAHLTAGMVSDAERGAIC